MKKLVLTLDTLRRISDEEFAELLRAEQPAELIIDSTPFHLNPPEGGYAE